MSVNWDNLNVGDPALNHSERYFEKRHIEHEDPAKLLQKNILAKNDPTKAKPAENKENRQNVSTLVVNNLIKSMRRMTEKNNQAKAVPLKAVNSRPSSRLADYAQIYEKKKKQLIAKQMQEEMRTYKPFRARSVPKFVARPTMNSDKGKDRRRSLSADGAKMPPPPPPPAHGPITRAKARTMLVPAKPTAEVKPMAAPRPTLRKPEVPRRTTAAVKPAPPVAAPRPTTYKRETMAPRKTIVAPPTAAPSTLLQQTKAKSKAGSTTRLTERQVIDKERRRQIEEKMRKEREEKRLRELEEQKRIRKQSEFKARPNPFQKKRPAAPEKN